MPPIAFSSLLLLLFVACRTFIPPAKALTSEPSALTLFREKEGDIQRSTDIAKKRRLHTPWPSCINKHPYPRRPRQSRARFTNTTVPALRCRKWCLTKNIARTHTSPPCKGGPSFRIRRSWSAGQSLLVGRPSRPATNAAQK
ncbi:hypothetical protein DFJ77DRAFT_231284 [Powellomyces hirtus]|nr:hypothetical protein DFJ77DRAFT_231284 [Powellomyces hirtus]